MWIPNVRNNEEDLDRIPLWERLLLPLTLVWLCCVALRSMYDSWRHPEQEHGIIRGDEDAG